MASQSKLSDNITSTLKPNFRIKHKITMKLQNKSMLYTKHEFINNTEL